LGGLSLNSHEGSLPRITQQLTVAFKYKMTVNVSLVNGMVGWKGGLEVFVGLKKTDFPMDAGKKVYLASYR
jgi:hypothetical protein